MKTILFVGTMMLSSVLVSAGCSDPKFTCQKACGETQNCVDNTNTNMGFYPCAICDTAEAENYRDCVKNADGCSEKINDCAYPYRDLVCGDGGVHGCY